MLVFYKYCIAAKFWGRKHIWSEHFAEKISQIPSSVHSICLESFFSLSPIPRSCINVLYQCLIRHILLYLNRVCTPNEGYFITFSPQVFYAMPVPGTVRLFSIELPRVVYPTTWPSCYTRTRNWPTYRITMATRHYRLPVQRHTNQQSRHSW